MTGILVAAAVAVPVQATFAASDESERTSQCTAHAEALPIPSQSQYDNNVSVWGGDPSGRYLVGGDVLWTDGAAEVLTGLSSDQVYAMGVNSSGVVVGYNFDRGRGWMYADGEYTELPGPADAEAVVPTAINADGDIVGYQAKWDSDGYWTPERALYWPADDLDAVQVLDAPRAAEAVDISDTGAIIGHVAGTDGDLDVGYVWSAPDDEGAPLPDPSGQASVLWANDISANGTWVAGGYWGNKAAAVRWNLETGETQEEPSAEAYAAVNNGGDAVTEGVEEPYTSSVIVRADGTKVHLASDEGRYELAEVLPERDAEVTAAGYSDFSGPAVYRGC